MRDVELGDVSTYVRTQCDPVMMAELGGPAPRESIEEKGVRDVQAVTAGTDRVKMIILGEAAGEVTAGWVVLWSHNGKPDVIFAGRLLRTNHWVINCAADLA